MGNPPRRTWSSRWNSKDNDSAVCHRRAALDIAKKIGCHCDPATAGEQPAFSSGFAGIADPTPHPAPVPQSRDGKEQARDPVRDDSPCAFFGVPRLRGGAQFAAIDDLAAYNCGEWGAAEGAAVEGRVARFARGFRCVIGPVEIGGKNREIGGGADSDLPFDAEDSGGAGGEKFD